MSKRQSPRRGKHSRTSDVEDLGAVGNKKLVGRTRIVTDRGAYKERLVPDETKERDGRMPDEEKKGEGSVLLLVVCFLGIFCSYFIYGLLQEAITKRSFGEERFRYFMFLVFCQCLVNVLVAWAVSWYQGQTLSLAPYGLYGALSLSYVGAMVASNSSLAFISYPTQVLGKSAKPIPVLILGVLFGRRSYPLIKYLCVLLIVGGVAIFLYKNKPSQAVEDEQWRLLEVVGVGELLVFGSLLLDGVTGVLQDQLRQSHKALQMMFAVNFFSPAYLLAGMLLTGEGFSVIGFISRHPEVLLNIGIFCIASAVGQIFIFTTIVSFGPLVCSIITTTRKFFTILASVLIFSNALLPRQWVGVALVFSGLGMDAFYSKSKQKNGQQSTQSV